MDCLSEYIFDGKLIETFVWKNFCLPDWNTAVIAKWFDKSCWSPWQGEPDILCQYMISSGVKPTTFISVRWATCRCDSGRQFRRQTRQSVSPRGDRMKRGLPAVIVGERRFRRQRRQSPAMIVGGEGWRQERWRKHGKISVLRLRPEGLISGFRSMSKPLDQRFVSVEKP